jgi:pimeloyl-ACP methyl ester carboxylesterase
MTKEGARRTTLLSRGLVAAGLLAFLAAAAGAAPSGTEMLTIRGKEQTLRVYGVPGQRVAIVTSGDGGWVHLGPEVAEHLADGGYYVIGFDARAYLSSFTHGEETLTVADVPRDFATIVDHAARVGLRPLLVGVSEGAGLSVLAATDRRLQSHIAGVVAMGLPDRNELGWHLRDSLIYVTKRTPNEPLFSVRDIVGRVSPVPLAIFQATRDEFVPPEETQAIVAAAREPCRLFTIEAGNHRFADARPELWQRLEEALVWIARTAAVSR